MGNKEVNGFTAVIRAIKRRDRITEGGRIETSTREGGDRRSEGQGKNSRWPERPGRGESGSTRSPRPSTAPPTHAPPRPRPRRRDHAKRARLGPFARAARAHAARALFPHPRVPSDPALRSRGRQGSGRRCDRVRSCAHSTRVYRASTVRRAPFRALGTRRSGARRTSCSHRSCVLVGEMESKPTKCQTATRVKTCEWMRVSILEKVVRGGQVLSREPRHARKPREDGVGEGTEPGTQQTQRS